MRVRWELFAKTLTKPEKLYRTFIFVPKHLQNAVFPIFDLRFYAGNALCD